MSIFHLSLAVYFYLNLFIHHSIFAFETGKHIFVITNEYLSTEAHYLKKQIIEDFSDDAKVYIGTKDFQNVHPWVYFPIFKSLLQNENASWFIFLEERTNLDPDKLLDVLNGYDSSKEFFIGKGLEDSSPTIIHHFDQLNKSDPLVYPDIRAGFALSNPILKRVTETWDPSNESDFSIDAPYELAKFLKMLSLKMHHDDHFCIQHMEGCATWYKLFRDCEEFPQNLSTDVHIAVKTCSKLAPERLPILRSTWLKDIPSFVLYSDVKDDALGTTSLGIPNTDHGHCSKTLQIIKSASLIENLKWLVIVDDDTLLSTDRLMSFISCYNHSLKIAAGQRYGFRTQSNLGFDYLTGGSGMIFSVEVVKLLSQAEICSCPSNDSPDDMVLGHCLRMAGVPLIHSSRFHQARPEDYHVDLLRGTKPISFHKFWMMDPVQEYQRWLIDAIDQRTKVEL